MTRTTNARIAGITLLAYIAIGVTQMFVAKGATSGTGTPAKLASIAQHAAQVQTNILLTLVTCFTALTLAVALYGITRDEDHELALLALVCRIGEGLLGVVSVIASLALLRLATDEARASGDAGTYALAAFLITLRGSVPTIAALFFAVGSTIFSWLLLRGRMIPVSLAWLGVFASALLVLLLPAQLLGLLRGPIVQWMWLPMAAFEIPLAVWLIVKGTSSPTRLPA